MPESTRSRFALGGSIALSVDGEPFALFTAEHLLELRTEDGKLVLYEQASGNPIATWKLDKEGNPIDPTK